MSVPGRRAVVDGLFETAADGETRLVGTRCTVCDTRYFPQAIGCRDPSCGARAVERVLLPPAGTIHSYTVQRYQPPPAFRMDDWAPYAIVLVDLGAGLRVMGMMKDVAFETLAIGLPVRLVEAVLYADAHGDVTTYMFVPEAAR